MPFVPPTPDAPTRLPMTAADIAELRDFISDGLGKVQVELREVREDQARLEALSVKHFASIDSRLGGVDSRLGGIDSRLGGVDSRLGGVESRLGGIEPRLGGIESRLGGVESRLGGIEPRLARVEVIQEAMRSDFRVFGEELHATNRRLDELREDMDQRFAEQLEQTRAGFAQWGDRVTSLEHRVDDLEANR